MHSKNESKTNGTKPLTQLTLSKMLTDNDNEGGDKWAIDEWPMVVLPEGETLCSLFFCKPTVKKDRIQIGTKKNKMPMLTMRPLDK